MDVIVKNKYFTKGTTRLEIEPIGKRGSKIKLTIFNDDKEVLVRELNSKALNIIEFMRQVKIKNI